MSAFHHLQSCKEILPGETKGGDILAPEQSYGTYVVMCRVRFSFHVYDLSQALTGHLNLCRSSPLSADPSLPSTLLEPGDLPCVLVFTKSHDVASVPGSEAAPAALHLFSFGEGRCPGAGPECCGLAFA